MIPFRAIGHFVPILAFAANLHAQAGVEYAAKSGAFSGAAGRMHVGACRLDSTLVSCVKHYYPLPFYIALVTIFLVLAVFMYPKRRA